MTSFVFDQYFLDNKVDIIDRKSTENKLQQSSYDSRKRTKKDRIERMDEEIQDMRRDLSRILFLLENRSLPREESVQKTEIEHDPWTIKI